MASYRAKYTEQEREQFSKRLKKARVDKGWGQADLARAACLHLPKDSPIGRQLVSSWEAARTIPEEQNLLAIEKALGVPQGTMLPRTHGGGTPATDKPQRLVQMSMLGNGQMRLVVNTEIDEKTGWHILEMLKEPS